MCFCIFVSTCHIEWCSVKENKYFEHKCVCMCVCVYKCSLSLSLRFILCSYFFTRPKLNIIMRQCNRETANVCDYMEVELGSGNGSFMISG